MGVKIVEVEEPYETKQGAMRSITVIELRQKPITECSKTL